MNAENSRHRKITVRPSTPSREEIHVIVAQLQNDLGEWMVPTITVSGPIPQIIESGRFARDVGVALLVANYRYEQWMKDVKDVERPSDDY